MHKRQKDNWSFPVLYTVHCVYRGVKSGREKSWIESSLLSIARGDDHHTCRSSPLLVFQSCICDQLLHRDRFTMAKCAGKGPTLNRPYSSDLAVNNPAVNNAGPSGFARNQSSSFIVYDHDTPNKPMHICDLPPAFFQEVPSSSSRLKLQVVRLFTGMVVSRSWWLLQQFSRSPP